MTSRIFKLIVLALLMVPNTLRAQKSQMTSLIKQSLDKLQAPSRQNILNCVAELKRIDAMFPDSVPPKYNIALQSLSYAIQYPADKQTEDMMKEAEESINKMEKMKGADLSDIYTFRGFYYMVRIVQNPAMNGARYYRDVIEFYQKALSINPNNTLAKQLQQQFQEGMKQAMKR